MQTLRAAILLLVLTAVLPACAPKITIRPVPADTPPGKLVEMVKAREAGLDGLRALVKVTVAEHGGQPKSFDGVLYLARPDNVRLTGISFMGFTVFDAVLRDKKFYFYQLDTGYLYTGDRAEAGKFLGSLGVSADPELLFRALFLSPDGAGYRYMLDRTAEGYSLYYVRETPGVMTPEVRADYDAGLNLVRKVLYDSLGQPYIYVMHSGSVVQDGFTLPKAIDASDSKDGYTVRVEFEKYIVNPDGIEDDFTITGGELKEIRTVE